MRQLEPSTCKGVGELVGVLVEAARNFLVGRIKAQCQVGGRHDGLVAFACHVGVGHRSGTGIALGLPLPCTCGALGQLPLVAKEVLEVVVAPLRWGGGPGALEAAGSGVFGVAFAVGILPALTHFFHGSAGWFATHEAWVSCTVHFAKGVSTGHQGHGFFVVHGHAAKGFAHVACRGKRIGVAVGAFRVDINQSHLHCTKRILEVAVSFVALISQHFGF